MASATRHAGTKILGGVNITEIYKEYLYFINYLEDKFPGGIVRAIHTACYVGAIAKYYNSPIHLLRISPTSIATREAFIEPACKRFNALKSTQIYTKSDHGTTWIKTDRILPALYLLYRPVDEHVRSPATITVARSTESLTWSLENYQRNKYGFYEVNQLQDLLKVYEGKVGKGAESRAMSEILVAHEMAQKQTLEDVTGKVEVE